MKLIPLDKEQQAKTTPKGTRHVAPHRLFIPVRDRRGRTRWYWGDMRMALPRRLNRLWQWLAKR